MRVLSRMPCLAVALAFAVALAGGALAPASAQERFRRTPPLPDPFRELKLPVIEKISLQNGLEIAVTRRPGLPIVAIQLVIMAGEADSPAALPAVATLTARMMGRRTREYSGNDIEEMIEAIGGDFSTTVSMDYTVLTFHAPAESTDRALELLRLMILQPEFSDLEVVTAKRVLSYELRDLEKTEDFVGRRQLFRVLFANHPYGTSTFSWDVIKSVTPKDIEAFYNRFYRPNNAVLILSGDIITPVSDPKITLPLAPWVRREVDRNPLSAPQPSGAQKVCFVDLPSAEDFVVYVGNLAMPPTSPDYYPFLVLNQVLGGTMANRLFMNLRESKGFAYEAFSEAEFFKVCGVYWAKARVTPATIVPSVKEVIREFRLLSTDRIPPDEIEQAKSFLIGNLPLKYRSLEGYSDRLARELALGLAGTDWNKASDNLMLVNADQALETAQKYFTPFPVVVIVGNRERALPALTGFDSVDLYDATGAFVMTLRKGVER